jgi:Iap family predicted aminopeptidase
LSTLTLDAADSVVISSEEEIKTDGVAVNCDNRERSTEVVKLFGKMGAANEDLVIEKFKGVENVVVRKSGNTEDVIVVGAHYDKASEGCGAIDNWSGVVALAHVYKTLRPLTVRKTMIFVAFGKEEQGLLGSRAMAKAIDKTQVDRYCAMVNLDSFGLGIPQVLENISSGKLTKRAADVARRMEMPFHQGVFAAGDGDSSPFRDRKIPAVTIHGLAGDPFKIVHTNQDQPSVLKASHLYLGYRLALSLVAEIDRCECNAFR